MKEDIYREKEGKGNWVGLRNGGCRTVGLWKELDKKVTKEGPMNERGHIG